MESCWQLQLDIVMQGNWSYNEVSLWIFTWKASYPKVAHIVSIKIAHADGYSWNHSMNKAVPSKWTPFWSISRYCRPRPPSPFAIKAGRRPSNLKISNSGLLAWRRHSRGHYIGLLCRRVSDSIVINERHHLCFFTSRNFLRATLALEAAKMPKYKSHPVLSDSNASTDSLCTLL